MKIEESNPYSLKSLMALMAFWLVFSTFPVRIIFREADGFKILPIHNLQSDKKKCRLINISFFRNYFCPLWSSSLSKENGFWLQFSGCCSPLSWLNFLFHFKFWLASSLTVVSFLHRCWSMSASGLLRKTSPHTDYGHPMKA